MSRPLRFVILNTHSSLNTGDAGIVLSQIRWLRGKYPGAVISLTSRTPRIDAVWLAPLRVRVFPPLLPAPGGRTRLAKRTGMPALRAAPGRRIGLLQAIRQSDLVISSGGGYFYSRRRMLPGPTFLQNIIQVQAALALRRPVVFFPQSFGPCRSQAAATLLARLLRRPGVKFVFAREEESLDYLRTIFPPARFDRRAGLCPDLAFLLRGNEGVGSARPPDSLPRPIVAVTLREWDSLRLSRRGLGASEPGNYLSALEGAVTGILTRRGGSIVIVPHSRGPRHGEDDRRISETFRKRLERRLPSGRVVLLDLPDVIEPGDMISFFKSADLMLATRFHSAIFALCAGTPVLTIGYQPKARGTMRLLGLERLSFEWDGLRGAELEARAEELLGSAAKTRAEIAARVLETREAIEEKLGRALVKILP